MMTRALIWMGSSVSPVRGGVQSEEILDSEDHDTGRVQTEERYFVLVSTRQHLQTAKKSKSL